MKSGVVVALALWVHLGCVAPLRNLPLPEGPIPEGAGHWTAELEGTSLEVFTYRPSGCTPKSFLLVFHGLHRNAEGYRDDARPLADQLCLIEIAPLFDESRFPTWRYQKGGIVRHGRALDPEARTGSMVLQLVAWVRAREGPLPYSMIGHSAGAQFLSRFAAFTTNDAARIVVANPSTYVLASLEVKAPFGLRGVSDRSAEDGLRAYLAQPVMLLLGQEDVGDVDRDDSPEAQAQGPTRYERGLNTFHAAEALSRDRGWTFNWRLFEVPGAGHSAGTMFSSPQALEALSSGP